MTLPVLPECILEGIIGLTPRPRHLFQAYFLVISEAPETQLMQFHLLLGPITDSSNMVKVPLGHFYPSSTARMCVRGYNWMKNRP